MAYMTFMVQSVQSERGLADAGLRLCAPIVILAVSVVALATAYIAEYGYDLEPCILCLYQRVPYALAILLAGGALVLLRGRNISGVSWLMAMAGVAFLAGGAIAVYHVGVEQAWWESAVCGGELAVGMNVQDLQAALLAPPPKSCDAIDWTFLGLSMASWNAMMSPVFAAAAIGAAIVMRRGER